MIHIQLVAMDNTLSDAITDLLAKELDIAVIGRPKTIDEAITPRHGEPTNVLLLQEGRTGDGLLTMALSPRPPALLCIAANGTEGWTVRLDTQRVPIEPTHDLAAAVRRAADLQT